MSADTTTQVYEVFIRTTPEKLWQAIIDPQLTQKYFFGTMVKTSLKPGEPITYEGPNGPMVKGEIISSDPPKKLVHSWCMLYEENLAKETSTVTWLIEEKQGGVCKLTAIHELPKAPHTAKHVKEDGWTMVLSGLKTVLETGAPMMTAPAGTAAA